MSESAEELRDRIREAVAKGGTEAVFDVLSGMGFAIEKEPEPGVGMRMRFGAATDDGFTTSMYSPSSERPAGWPAEVPFLPGVGGSLTLFERPGRGLSVQWVKVPDTAAAVKDLMTQCLTSGWRVLSPNELSLPSSLPGGAQAVVLQRGELQRTVMSVVVKGFGMVQLLERPPGGSCGVGSAPRS